MQASATHINEVSMKSLRNCMNIIYMVLYDELTWAMTRDIELAITVGGDGFALAVHPYLDRVPLLRRQ